MTDKRSLDALVGANIKRYRERAGYIQEQFSEMIGLEPKSLSAAERGVVGVSLSTLVSFCRVLSIASDPCCFLRERPVKWRILCIC